ncbi:SLATT domain-containing protein [Weissella paramesenteroides]
MNQETLSINEIINNTICDLKRTRTNRLLASQRLLLFANRWNNLSFLINVVAMTFAVISVLNHVSKYFTWLSTFYAIYVILLQYFLANKDYNARSSKLHYEQLEINSIRMKLKILSANKELVESDKARYFQEIFSEYNISLNNNENHTKLDDQRGKDTSSKHRDFSFDNVFINLNLIICIVVIIFGWWMLRYG